MPQTDLLPTSQPEKERKEAWDGVHKEYQQFCVKIEEDGLTDDSSGEDVLESYVLDPQLKVSPEGQEPSTAYLTPSNNDKKHGGKEYNVLDAKLQVFYNYCLKIGLPEDQYYNAYLVMLKGRTSKPSTTFEGICAELRSAVGTAMRSAAEQWERLGIGTTKVLYINRQDSVPICLRILTRLGRL